MFDASCGLTVPLEGECVLNGRRLCWGCQLRQADNMSGPASSILVSGSPGTDVQALLHSSVGTSYFTLAVPLNIDFSSYRGKETVPFHIKIGEQALELTPSYK